MDKIMRQNMIRLLQSFILEALFIVASGEGELQKEGEYAFRELNEMSKVVRSLFVEREGSYTNYEVETDIVRYVSIFYHICSIPNECNFNYEDMELQKFFSDKF